MLELFKGIAMLLLPPGGLIVLGMLGLKFYRKLWGRMLIVASLLALYLLSIAPVRDLLTRPLEYASPTLSIDSIPTENTAIVLLGGGLYEHAPEYHQNLPSSDAMMRTIYAAEISQQTGLSIYASGGRPLNPNGEAEAVVLKRWLVRFGIPAHNIRTESSSRNTLENAKNIAALLKKANIQQLVLVTNATHMPRSRACFIAQGLTVIAAPTKYLSKQTAYQPLDFLPSAGTLANSSFALHEYLGLLWYRLRYANKK